MVAENAVRPVPVAFQEVRRGGVWVQHRAGWLLAILGCCSGMFPLAIADEIRTDRAPDGTISISIKGDPDVGAAEAAASHAGDQLSVVLSRRRTELEKKTNEAADALKRTRRLLANTEAEEFQAPYASYSGANASSAAASAVAAMIYLANKFTDDKIARLRALHDQERDELQDLARLYREFDELRALARSSYGGTAPGWWRDRMTCEACPSTETVAAALK